MKITVFGATGKVGTLLVDRALGDGNDVIAVVREPSRLAASSHGTPRVVTANVMDPDSIAPAVDGTDAVISAIGPTRRGPTRILGDSARSIIDAMERVGSKRLLTISGSMIDDTGDGLILKYVGKPLTRRLLKDVCADMLRAESEIHSSRLDWTIFRPPNLADGPATGRYRTALDRNLPHGFRVRRADLAAEMLKSIDDFDTIHRHVFIAA
jgi:putative NADH-flavin reductase